MRTILQQKFFKTGSKFVNNIINILAYKQKYLSYGSEINKQVFSNKSSQVFNSINFKLPEHH